MKRALAACALLLSCSERATVTERPSDTQAALGGSVAARVGGEALPLSLVEAVANAQHLTAKDAARRIIDDEIAANRAKNRGLDQRPPTSWNLTATRARILADRLRAEAVKAGPPSDAEVARLSEAHWSEVDRPPTVHVVHAIARRPKKDELAADAKKVAEAILAATKDATTAADFEAKAKAVAHSKDIETRVEDLPAFTKEGWIPDGGGMDAKFAAAAYALPAPGAMTSGLVETQYGWHVIRLVERLPERRMPMEDRRKAFAEEVLAMRGHDAVAVVLKERSAKTQVEVSPAAESLMQSVSIPLATEQAANP